MLHLRQIGIVDVPAGAAAYAPNPTSFRARTFARHLIDRGVCGSMGKSSPDSHEAGQARLCQTAMAADDRSHRCHPRRLVAGRTGASGRYGRPARRRERSACKGLLPTLAAKLPRSFARRIIRLNGRSTPHFPENSICWHRPAAILQPEHESRVRFGDSSRDRRPP